MKSFTCIIRDPLGMHARPAGKLAKLVKQYPGSKVTVTKGDSSVNATQLMKLMGMGVKQNDTVTVTVEGGDEDVTFAAVKDLFATDFSAEFNCDPC
jgi:phosphocarrier protein